MITHKTVEAHIRNFYKAHVISETAWLPGPTASLWPQFRVLAIEPGPRVSLWSYVTVGAFQVREEHPLEFVVLAPHPGESLIELVTMTTYYHHTHGLGHGHTVPIGRPWIPGADCDHLLISRPYPLGPELEICDVADGHFHVVWLLPITESEKNYKIENGLEELEQRFEEKRVEYWRGHRNSVV